MAGLDSSIILGAKPIETPNALDMFTKALTMKELSQKSQIQDRDFQAQNAVRDAYRNNVVTNPDGSQSVNMPGVVNQVMKTNPVEGQKLAVENRQMQLANQQAQMKAQTDRLSYLHTSLGQVHDQTSLDEHNARTAAAGLNNPNDPPPTTWNPQAQQWITDAYKRTSDATQRNADRDYGLKAQEAQNKKRELDMEYYKTYGGAPGAPGSPGPAPGGGPPAAPAAAGVRTPTSASQPQAQAPAAQVSEVDPATLVSRYAPPAKQQKIFDEIEAAQNTSASAPKILAAFDQAAKEVRPTTGGTGTSLTALVPGMASPGQKAMHALMGPTFKDVEGTVRQAAMDNMNNNTTPQFGDDDSTIKIKRDALMGYLKSKSSAPTSKGFGIDLKKFKSTNYVPTVNMRAPDGSIRAVREDQVEDAKKAGGKEI